jgi:hypothetical protein
MFGTTYDVARRFMLRELLPLKSESSSTPLRREETGEWSYPEDGDPEITAPSCVYFIDETDDGVQDGGDTDLPIIDGPDYTTIDWMHGKLDTLYSTEISGFGVDVLGTGYSDISGEDAFADLTY